MGIPLLSPQGLIHLLFWTPLAWISIYTLISATAPPLFQLTPPPGSPLSTPRNPHLLWSLAQKEPSKVLASEQIPIEDHVP